MVVARFAEDLSFLDELGLDAIVYNKGPPLPHTIPLPNVGREAHTYLHHILTHYDSLADITVFLPGSCKDSREKWLETQAVMQHVLLYRTSVFGGKPLARPLHIEQGDFKIDRWKSTNASNAAANPESHLEKCPERPLKKWYTRLGLTPVNGVCYHGIFAVTRDDIKKKPKAFYAELIAYLDSHSNPEALHYIERSWLAVFS